MSVEVLIERKFRGAPYPEHLQAVHDLRIKAMQQRGHIRGETFVNFEDQREVVVLSSWSSAADWKAWVNNEERRRLEDELAPHLEEPPRIRILMPSADYLKEALTAFAGGE